MKKVFKMILWILVSLIALAGLGIGYLTLSEYRPAAVESAELTGASERAPKVGDTLTALSFNVGYCGLPAESDFFMDGGKMSRVASRDIVERNLAGVVDVIQREACDLTLLQEVDRAPGSKRSYYVDEAGALDTALGGQSAFATNFQCSFVPIPPLDPIGQVHSGIMTRSNLNALEASRIRLPSPFSWPLSTCNLKRCLLVTRIPVDGQNRQLVVVNLHLEAYDDGAGKAAQTKVLVDFLTQEYDTGNYVVAGGDFNQWLPGVDQTKFPAKATGAYIPGTIDASILPTDWTYAADDSTPTCRSNDMAYDAANPLNQLYVIDGFILSPNVQLQSVKTLPLNFQYADHNPVRVEFTLS